MSATETLSTTKCKYILNNSRNLSIDTNLLSFSNVFIAIKQFSCIFIVIYVLWSSYEISLLRSDIQTLKKELLNKRDPQVKPHTSLRNVISSPDTGDIFEHSGDQEVQRYKRAANSTSRLPIKSRGKKRKHRRRKRKKRHCRCKNGLNGTMGPQGLKGDKGEPGPPFATKAVHYIAQKPEVHRGTRCQYIWNGVYCSANATFVNQFARESLQFFTEKDWNTNMSSPLKQETAGNFTVQQDGLLLFYLNIAFWSNDPFRDAVVLYVGQQRVLQCVETLDFIKPSTISVYQNAKEKTCSMTGLHYAKKGQLVNIRVVQSGTAFSLMPDMTSFGVVLIR